MRRHALGILTVLLLIMAVYGWSTYGLNEGQTALFFSSCWRIGLVFGMAWLAFPQLTKLSTRTSPRFMLLMLAIGMTILVRPKSVILLGPVMLVLAALQFAGWLMKPPPKTPGHSSRPRADSSASPVGKPTRGAT
ncbi:MAG: hypothetical protein ACYC3X_12630 [Pirellulaceae bacterium]